MLTADLIRRFAPIARADIVAGLVEGWPKIYAAGINTPRRLQHFMAECHNETGGFRQLEENLNYTAAQLVRIWPSRFTAATALTFAHRPEAIANRVYGSRYGNTAPGDGWRFRGGGLIQTTFKANYIADGFGENPEDIRKMPGALDGALSWWSRNGMNRLVETAGDQAARRKANGGTIGMENFLTQLARARGIFVRITAPSTAASPATAGPPAPLASPALTKPAPSGGLLRSGAQATGGAVRGGLNAIWNGIHDALKRGD